MRLLNDNDRSYVLQQLAMAPDSVLADAMLAFNAIRDKTVAVRKLTEGAATVGVDVAIPGSEKTIVAEVVIPARRTSQRAAGQVVDHQDRRQHQGRDHARLGQ